MKSAVVICPGRGTYNKSELGYLSRHFPDAALLAGLRGRNVSPIRQYGEGLTEGLQLAVEL